MGILETTMILRSQIVKVYNHTCHAKRRTLDGRNLESGCHLGSWER